MRWLFFKLNNVNQTTDLRPELVINSAERTALLLGKERPANEPNARQMRISIDADFHFEPDLFRDFRAGQMRASPLSTDQFASAALVVNVFDGGPKTTVYYRMDRREQPRANDAGSAA